MSEKVTIKVERKKLHLPTIALRGLVVFPNNLVHFEVGREKSIAAVEWAMANNSNVFLVAQKSMDTTEPQQADLFSYGVVAEVKQVLRVSGDLVKVLVEGKYRAKLSALDASGDFLLSEVRPAPVRAGKADDAVETEALLRALKAGFDEYLGMNPRLGKDVVFAIVSSDDPAFLSEYMPANLLFRYEDKQAVMDEGTLNGRLKKLIEMLRRECQVMKIEKEIAEKVNESMDKNQRDTTCTNSCTSSATSWARATTPTPRPTSTAAGSPGCTLPRTARRSCSRKWTALPRCRAPIRRQRSSAPIWTPALTCRGTPLRWTTLISAAHSRFWTATTTA